LPLKVLLADDSMTAQNMGKKILTDAGYQVIAVSNGAQALKKLASEKPDLVVLDVYMPGYSGLEVCERIKNAPDTARIPVVLCVAKMEPFKPEEGTRVRADAVIVKPFEATDLVARVQELGENLQRRSRQQRVEAPEPAAAPDIEVPEVVEPAHPVAHVEVPQELAVEPAVGMELMTEEPAPQASAPSFPTKFEIEHERQPTETIRDVRMQAADGLSGVFEMPPEKSSKQNAVPEFEIVSQPGTHDEPSANDIHGQAAEAARVEPRSEFIVDRVSISIPLKESSSLPERQGPPAEAPTVKDFALPMEHEAAPAPAFVEQATPSSGPGYTGIYEFAPPKGSLDSPAVETRIGDMRSSAATDLVEPMVSAPRAFSSEMQTAGTVALETAEQSAESTVSAVPLPVWVAEEVALDQCEVDISLEEEMRAALAPTHANSATVEVPLAAAAETIAAFTTEQPAEMPRQFEAREQIAAERPRENFDVMSDEIVCEAVPAQPWYSTPDSTSPMPEPSAMDAVASLREPVPDFSSEGTVAPDFSIPGHSFDAVPADEFGPPTSAPLTIEAAITQPEAPPQFAEAAQFEAPTADPEESRVEATASVDQSQNAFGAMAQAIVESPALSSVKGAEAEPIVEAIVTRMLEQIKPELIAHVLRELEKK